MTSIEWWINPVHGKEHNPSVIQSMSPNVYILKHGVTPIHASVSMLFLYKLISCFAVIGSRHLLTCI